MRQEFGRILTKWNVNRIHYGNADNPKDVLGRHMVAKGQIISAFHPHAIAMKVLFSDGRWFPMERIEKTQVFASFIEETKKVPYRIEMTFSDGHTFANEDPYAFPSKITKRDSYLFGMGIHYGIYEKMGAHPMEIDGIKGTYFAVWAPHVVRASVVGNFNHWDGRCHPMHKTDSEGIFEIFIPNVGPGEVYKYEFKLEDGYIITKTDPYGNSAEVRPNNASVVADLNSYQWTDAKFMRARAKAVSYERPMSIYEVHLPSWKRNGEDGMVMLSYRELAHSLCEYVLDMGYTHVELIGILEHPYDGSWGYQVTGYYAPTSRHGSTKDFMYFVDYMHNHGIGVILDWVPGHFSKDSHGLAKFDGACLYEHPDPRKGEQPQWGTYVFDYEKKEVKNFLIANALFWMNQFHIDGIRVDAVASMLYADHCREEDRWMPNIYGGNENLEGIEFIKHLNSIVKKETKGGCIIAEESTAWKGVSQPLTSGGLGFDYKWNMGWMHDFLEYMKVEPEYRKDHHHKLLFSMAYFHTEHYIQALSHDEVVHEKGSMLMKMPGNDFEKFANLKCTYGFMYGHPGKKLLFMGQDFAQRKEWDEKYSIDWHLLEEEPHKKMQNYMKKLLHLYKEHKALYELDYHPRGFEWMNCEKDREGTVSFVRRSKTGERSLLFVCNFTAQVRGEFRVGVPKGGRYKLVLNSDDAEFGGEAYFRTKPTQQAEKSPCDGKEYSILMNLPPLSVLVFEYNDSPAAE